MPNEQGQDLPVQAAITIDTGMNERIVQRVDANVSQEIVVTTADKVRLVLRDAMQKIELRDAWKAPLGILVTLLVVLPAFNSLQDFLWIPKNVWQALLLLCTALSAVWLASSLARRKRAPTVEDILNNLRQPSSRIDRAPERAMFNNEQ